MFPQAANQSSDDETRFLEVSRDFLFFRFARDSRSYLKDIRLTPELLKALREREADVFTFVDRGWCNGPNPTSQPSKYKIRQNMLFMHLKSYGDWWNSVGRKSRNMRNIVRKAQKSGLRFVEVKSSEEVACDILRIYRSSPIKQERRNFNLDVTLEEVKEKLSLPNYVIVGAYLGRELVGFGSLRFGDRAAYFRTLASLEEHKDKAVNNGLIAKVIEVCLEKGSEWLVYASWGYWPQPESVVTFAINNGFRRGTVYRYYVPLTPKGHVAARLFTNPKVTKVMELAITSFNPLINWLDRNAIARGLVTKNIN